MPGSTPSSATPSNATIGQRELGPALLPQPRRARDVGERQRRGDDDGAEGRLRHVLHEPGREQEHEGDDTPRRRRPVTCERARPGRPRRCATRSC